MLKPLWLIAALANLVAAIATENYINWLLFAGSVVMLWWNIDREQRYPR